MDKVDFLTKYYLGSGKNAESERGLLHRVKEKLLNKEIDHSDSRMLKFPPLDGLGVLRIGSSKRHSLNYKTIPAAKRETHNSNNASHLRWKLTEAMQSDVRKITREAIPKTVCATETTMAGARLGDTEEGLSDHSIRTLRQISSDWKRMKIRTKVLFTIIEIDGMTATLYAARVCRPTA